MFSPALPKGFGPLPDTAAIARASLPSATISMEGVDPHLLRAARSAREHSEISRQMFATGALLVAGSALVAAGGAEKVALLGAGLSVVVAMFAVEHDSCSRSAKERLADMMRSATEASKNALRAAGYTGELDEHQAAGQDEETGRDRSDTPRA